jgi:hypothetical protein
MDYVTVSRFRGIGGALLFASKPGSNPAGSCTLSAVPSEYPNIPEVARSSLKWTDPFVRLAVGSGGTVALAPGIP